MKPPPFAYLRVSSFEEAVVALAQDEDAKLLAGGQSLVPMLNLRLARPSLLVDLSFLPTPLVEVSDRDSIITIPATTTHSALLAQGAALARLPLLRACLPLIGHAAVRNRGTMGGSLAHADPSAELCTAAVAAGAEVATLSSAGERVVAFADLVEGPFSTGLRADEIIVAVGWHWHDHWGTAYEELALRAGDFALVGVAAMLRRDLDGKVADASVAVSGLAGLPLRLAACEQALRGTRPADRFFDEVAQLSASAGDPVSDAQAPASYRRALAVELVRRALVRAWERCPGGEA